jgi:hypothetical protein
MWSVSAELPDPGGGTDAVPSRTTRGSSSGRVEIAPKVAPAEGPPRRGRTTPPRGHEPTVAGPRRHSTWSGTTSVAVPRGPAGVQVARASGPKGPGARLGRRSHWRLGSGEGRVQVGSDLGHDLLGAADPGLPAAFAAGAALAALGSGRGPDGDLVPGDLLVDGDGHGSPPIGRVWPNLSTWEAGHQLARWGPGHAVGRGGLGHAKVRAGADRRARRCAPAGPLWSRRPLRGGRSRVRH